MSRLALALLLAALLLHGAALAWLASLQSAGPARRDVVLPEGGPPATFYLPREAIGLRGLPEPAPRGERPPALLLAHGYSADREMMSSLARRLAKSGIAVLAIDFPGHGENRAPFRMDVHGEPLAGVLAKAAEYLRASPWVDGTRIAVGGHSMGAWAALRFAEDDGAVEATLLLSGSGFLLGPYLPPNPLVLWAERDPVELRERARWLADRLAEEHAGAATLPLATTRGAFTEGSAVRAVELAGHDHVTMLWAEGTARASSEWLAAAFGTKPPAEPVGDARLPALGVAVLTLVLALALLGPALAAPLSPVLLRLVPTPERLLAAGGAAALLLPFFLGLEGLLRRGSPLAAALQGLAGKGLVLASLVLGATTGLLPGFVMLLLGPFALVFGAVEIVAAGAYARSGDVLALAVLEAAWVGWTVTASLPMRA